MSFLSFLAFGSLYFWLFIAAFIIFEVFLSDNESYGVATWVLIAFGVVFAISNGAAITWLLANPLIFILGVISYIALGVAWSFYKWRGHVKSTLDRQKTHRKKFLIANGVKDATVDTQIPDELREKWFGKSGDVGDFFEDEYYHSSYSSRSRPLAKNSKGRIVGWMSYWPFQVLATIVRDPFIEAYKLCIKSFDKMSEKIYGADSSDFK